MQVDSSPPFTSVAQSMGQAVQPPPPPKSNDGDTDTLASAKAATPNGVGGKVDISA